MAEPEGSLFRRYVFDASALIELERGNHLRKLENPEGVIVPERVAREGRRLPRPLRSWLDRHLVLVSRFATRAESALYLELLAQTDPKIHDGEAAAIAMASARSGVLVSDDRSSQTKAAERQVRWVAAEVFLQEWLHPS